MINGLGKRLLEKRIQYNMVQKEVAAHVGVSTTMISYYENGETTPTLETIMKLAALYHCSIDYLVLGRACDECKRIDVSGLTDKECTSLQQFLYAMKGKF